MRCFLAFYLLLFGTVACLQGADEAPSRDIPLIEKKFEQLSDQKVSPLGTMALAIAPAKWKHAETEHFIIHYRRPAEAQKTVREIEYDLWFIANLLAAGKERYAKKSHIFIFENYSEWCDFRKQANVAEWFASFAQGEELYLHVGGEGERFKPELLAHEVTHAVVSRLYPRQRWPRWLNEGFAEYISRDSLLARSGVWDKAGRKGMLDESMPVKEIVATKDYPKDDENKVNEGLERNRFYQSSQRLVRFLLVVYPKERFPRFVDAIIGGAEFEPALLKIYGDRVQDFASFDRRYNYFNQ